MPNAWITHVKAYAAEHNVPYGVAMKQAKASYTPKGAGKAEPEGGFIGKLVADQIVGQIPRLIGKTIERGFTTKRNITEADREDVRRLENELVKEEIKDSKRDVSRDKDRRKIEEKRIKENIKLAKDQQKLDRKVAEAQHKRDKQALKDKVKAAKEAKKLKEKADKARKKLRKISK